MNKASPATMFRIIPFLWLFSILASADEVEKNANLGMVKVSYEEGVRRDLVAAMGNLEKFKYLMVHPIPPVYASGVLERKRMGAMRSLCGAAGKRPPSWR